MIEKVEINDIAKETLSILYYFNSNFIKKIPKYFINELEQLAKNSNLVIHIDKNKSLSEQNILLETKELIALIYYSYIATEIEKEEITKIWNENERLYEEKIKIKYNNNNMFADINQEKNNNAIVKYEKNIFRDILEKLKKIFLKKK